jgi:hypothetical protein
MLSSAACDPLGACDKIPFAPRFDEGIEIGEHCLSPQGELRSRRLLHQPQGTPQGQREQAAFFGLHLAAKSDQPPGCPGKPAELGCNMITITTVGMPISRFKEESFGRSW